MIAVMSLPAPKEVRDLFEDLLGRHITVSPADPILASAVPRSLVALYVDSNLKLSAVIGMALPLAVYAGVALGLIPPGGAQDCVDDGVLTPMIAENVTEVCNVMSGLLNKGNGPHLRLYQRFLPGEGPPTDATGYLLALGRRLDLIVEVAGYGTGKLSIALAF